MAQSADQHTFHLTVEAHGGEAENRIFTVDLGDTVAAVVNELGATEPTWLMVERTGKTLLPTQLIGESDLRNGDVVRMIEPRVAEAFTQQRLGASIEILTGPRAGEKLTMEAGELSIGRAADNGFVIIDPGVSRFHGSLELSPDGTLTVHDHGSTNGVIVEENRITGSEPIESGRRVLVGQTWFVPTVAPVNELGMSQSDGTVLGALNSIVIPPAPAQAASDPPPTVEFPNPPAPTRGGLFRGMKAPDESAVAAFHDDLVEIRSSIEMLQQIEMTNRQAEGPSVEDLMAAVAEDPPVVWRSSADAGLMVRLGVAALASRLEFVLPPGGDPALRHEMSTTADNYRHIADAPVLIDLAAHSVVRISGAPDETRALTRSMITQLGLRYRPSEVRVVAAAIGTHSADWRWLGWLPHARLGDDVARPAVASDPESACSLMADILPAGAARTILLLDDAAAGDETLQADLTQLLEGDVPITVIAVVDDGDSADEMADRLPPSASVEISEGFATLVESGDDGKAIMAIACESISVDDADRTARRIAPMVEPVVPSEPTPPVKPDDLSGSDGQEDLGAVESADVPEMGVAGAAVAGTVVAGADLTGTDDASADSEPLEADHEPQETTSGEGTGAEAVAEDNVLVGSFTGELDGSVANQASSPGSRSDFFKTDSGAIRLPTAPPAAERGHAPKPASRSDRGAEQNVIATTWERSEKTPGAAIALGVERGNGHLTVGFEISDGRLLVIEGANDAYLSQVVAGLAVTQSPFKANFVLVDALGGRMLATCDRLPHTVASVTNPSPAATKSALAAMAAELDRREALIATVGCDTIADLHRSNPSSSVPYLVMVVSDPAGAVLGDSNDSVASGLWGESIVTVEAARELAELARRGADLGLCMIVGRSAAGPDDPFAANSPSIVRFTDTGATVTHPGEKPLEFDPSPPRMAALTPNSLERLVAVLADVFRSSGRPEPVSLSL